MNRPPDPKVTQIHLDRSALVYLRQSSAGQVRRNTESLRLQLALKERAQALGWDEAESVSLDLGSSAAIGAEARAGFDRILASVALGEVGIIISFDASRLSRTDRDWCRLLEVCQVFGTLIADGERVYDLNSLDDQLVLGIKATMSVAELQVMNKRLILGMREKASRGELIRLLPPGFTRDPSDAVMKDPDDRVQQAITLVFRKFREVWSARGTYQWFIDEEVELPVNKSHGGQMKLSWQIPSQSFIYDMLRNPFYAGAYVFGRRLTKMGFLDGRLVKRAQPIRDAVDCNVLIRDHHEGYISWETYEENQAKIRSNSVRQPTDTSTAAVRSGTALLSGLLRCGRCGRPFNVRYSGRLDTNARYGCKGGYAAGGRYCVSFAAGKVDNMVTSEVLQVITPVGVRASLVALERVEGEDDDRREAVALHLQQLEYEAQRAFEQYNEVDPRNRLVASQLERRWNSALEQIAQAEARLASLECPARPVGAVNREKILQLGAQFGEVWNAPACSPELKKKILRTVIKEIVVSVDDERSKLDLVIHWTGGTHTRIQMDRPGHASANKTAPKDLEVIRNMAPRYSDEEIARVLVKLKRRTTTGLRWTQVRVATVRRRKGIRVGEPPIKDPDILSMKGAARHCAVSEKTIRNLVAAGVLAMNQVVPYAPWEIRRSDLDAGAVQEVLERLRRTGKLSLQGECPDRPDGQGRLFSQFTGADSERHCE